MLVKIISLLSFLSLLISSVPAQSAVFNISSGDVAGLIAVINTANANGEENTIILRGRHLYSYSCAQHRRSCKRPSCYHQRRDFPRDGR